jgi:hypothetical protein
MGANAQIAVPAFTAGQVLTATQQTQINTGIPVFATTVTRDAAFGGTGEKTLAEGQFAYIEATDLTQYYDGAAWQNVGVAGLTYITQATPSAQTTISINNCFTSAYENYKIIMNVSAYAVTDGNIGLRLRVGGVDTSVNYQSQRLGGQGGTPFASTNVLGTDEMYFGSIIQATPRTIITADIASPQIATPTSMNNQFGLRDVVNGNNVIIGFGFQSDSTAFDGFTLISTQNMTGTIRVYGYQNS